MRLPMLAVVAAAVLFGTTGTAQELGPDNTSPLVVGAMRLLVGSLALWAFAGRRPEVSRLGDHLVAVVIGAVGVALYQPGFFLGTERSGVALGTVVALGSGPVFAGTMEWAWFGRRPSPTWAIATAVMTGGGVVLVLGRGGESAFSVIGTLGSLSAGFGYALFAMVTKHLIERNVNSTEALAWQFSLGALLLLPTLVVAPPIWLDQLSGLLMVLHLGILATGLAYLLYGWGLRHMATSSAVTLTLAEPVTAAISAVLLLGERLRWYGWLGVTLVFIGLAVAGRDRNQQELGKATSATAIRVAIDRQPSGSTTRPQDTGGCAKLGQ